MNGMTEFFQKLLLISWKFKKNIKDGLFLMGK